MNEIYTGSCQKCPIISDQLNEIQALRDAGSKIAEGAMSHNLDDSIPETFEKLKDFAEYDDSPFKVEDNQGNVYTIESPDDLAKAARISAASQVDELEAEEKANLSFINAVTDRCPGPLTMWAKKAGMVVQATVCLSPMAPNEAQLEPVKIHRRQA